MARSPDDPIFSTSALSHLGACLCLARVIPDCGMTLLPLKHILLISYDERLLILRRILLEEAGYRVSSALGLKEALANCKDGAFDLLIFGHSIPRTDKVGLVKTFRAHSSAPILSLWERDEILADSVDYLAFSDTPETLLGNVASILAREAPPRRVKE